MPADVVFRVGRAYEMTAERRIHQAVAVEGGRITAVGRARDELDALIGPGTAVIDDPELVLYPAFADTHNHQLLAARDLDYVPLEQARSLDELVQTLRGRGRLLREDGDVGILAPGAFADIVGFRADLLDCPVDDLPSQQPALTLVGGRPVHDPDGLLGLLGAAGHGAA